MIPRSALVFLLLVAACSEERPPVRGQSSANESRAKRVDTGSASGGSPATDRARATDQRPAILFLGTSLTAGYGLDPDLAFPALIQRRLDSVGLSWQAINAGVSGETSAGALRRLGGLLEGPIRIVVLETGANDGLRGLEPDSTRANLEEMVRRIRSRDSTIAIVLAGMQAPPNLGPRFTARFSAVFPEVAARERLALIPFLLEGVGGVDALNQADGIHPTALGHRIVADNVWRVIVPLLRRAGR